MVYSAGSDKEYGIVTDNNVQNGDPRHQYSMTGPLKNDPYTLLPNSAAPVQITTVNGNQINAQIGALFQDSNGNETFQDNIHNHSAVSD